MILIWRLYYWNIVISSEFYLEAWCVTYFFKKKSDSALLLSRYMGCESIQFYFVLERLFQNILLWIFCFVSEIFVLFSEKFIFLTKHFYFCFVTIFLGTLFYNVFNFHVRKKFLGTLFYNVFNFHVRTFFSWNIVLQ